MLNIKTTFRTGGVNPYDDAALAELLAAENGGWRAVKSG
jgi:hypothetical protein